MKFLVNGEPHAFDKAESVEVLAAADRLYVRTESGTQSAVVIKQGGNTLVSYCGRIFEIEKAAAARKADSPIGGGEFRAPMPGSIVDVLVSQGEQVHKGQKILVLEAMKTQQPVYAPFDGIVKALSVSKGDQVAEGDLMVKIEPPQLAVPTP